jgi:hypothetical protein
VGMDARRMRLASGVMVTEGRGLGPRWDCSRRFSSSPKSFAFGCVWLYLPIVLRKEDGALCV